VKFASHQSLAKTSSRRDRARIYGTQLARALTVLTAWPALLVVGSRYAGPNSEEALALFPPQPFFAATLAVASVLLLLLAWVTTPLLIFQIAAFCFLLGLLSRELESGLAVSKLADTLRRSLLPPYPTVVAIAAFDYISLVSLAVLILKDPTAHTISLARLPSEATYVWSVHHFRTLLTNQQSLRIFLVAATSGVFFSMVVGDLYKLPKFMRTPEDNAALASNLLHAGNSVLAKSWLAKTLDESDYGSVLRLRAQFALDDNDLESAERYMRASLVCLEWNLRTMADDIDEVYFGLASQAHELNFTPDIRWTLIDRAKRLGVSDACLSVILNRMRNLGLAGLPSTVEDWTSKLATIGFDDEKYPLVWTTGLLVVPTFTDRPEAERIAQARRCLERAEGTISTDMVKTLIVNAFLDGAELFERTGGAASIEEIGEVVRAQVRKAKELLTPEHIQSSPFWIRLTLCETLKQLEFLATMAYDFEALGDIIEWRFELLNGRDAQLTFRVIEAMDAASEELATF
jgi:hypothetical protein